MSTGLVNVDRLTPMLLPPDLRDWVPERHMVHFILEAIDHLDLSCFRLNWRGSGSEQYPPGTMLALLVYCYATGRFGSRRIEEATYSDVVVGYICANYHPDHDTICTFRRQNGELFKEMFVKVLAMAAELGALKKVGTVSVDGTKIHAHASKHSAVSYKRAGEMIEHLQLEVEALVKKAEAADATPLDEGLSIPEEISRREDRIAKLKKAKAVIEERFEQLRKEKQAHGRTVAQLERGEDPPPPDENASMTEQMRWRLQTKKGKERYKLRKQTVEPVFGVIKEAMGFRQFHLRGSPKVDLEWDLVTLAYNMRRMFKLVGEKSLPQPGWLHSYGY